MNIALDNVSFSYNKKTPVIRELNYTFNSGANYVLTGANGSGKTTLTKLIAGIIRPDSGQIIMGGEDIKKKSLSDISSFIGYLFQNPDHQLFAGTVREELTFPYEITGTLDNIIDKKIDEVIDKFNLKPLENRFPLTLSGGEKQKLALATLFIRDIRFLVLDEPYSAIDKEGRAFLSALLNEFVSAGGGALIITHDLENIGDLNCAVRLNMEGGRIET
jgi:energy-coupling factor transport system ATP-binding protein